MLNIREQLIKSGNLTACPTSAGIRLGKTAIKRAKTAARNAQARVVSASIAAMKDEKIAFVKAKH